MRIILGVVMGTLLSFAEMSVAQSWSDFSSCQSTWTNACQSTVGCSARNEAGIKTAFPTQYSYTQITDCYCDGALAWYENCEMTVFHEALTTPPTGGSAPPRHPECTKGSIVDLDAATLGESIPIVGAKFSLNYSSLWSAYRTQDYTVTLPIVGTTADPGVTTYGVTVLVAGQTHTFTFPNIPNQTLSFTWDGNDSLGNPVLGSVPVDIKVVPDSSTTVIATLQTRVGTLKSKLMGFGAWLPTNVHFYDYARQLMYRGDGSVKSLVSLNQPSLYGNHLLVPDGSVVYEFDLTGRQLYTRTFILGTIIETFNYNTSGLLASISEPFGRTTTFNRDGYGNLTSIVAPDGATTTVTVNSAGLLTSVINPNSETNQMTYISGTDLMASFQKPGGQESDFTYDTNALLTQDAHTAGFSLNINKSYSNPFSYEVLQSTGLGRGTTVDVTDNLDTGYRAGNYSRMVSYPSGASQTATTNDSSTTFQIGGVTTEYDYANDIRFGSNYKYVSAYTYGTREISTSQSVLLNVPADIFTVNQLNTMQTLNGNTTTTAFVGSTHSVTTTSPVGRVRISVLDTYERVVSDQWASDTAVNYTYTSDKLTGIAQGARTASLSYNPTTGLLTSYTDPLSHSTAFAYDLARRLTDVTLPDLRVVHYTYDSNSNVVGITPPSGSAHAFVLTGEKLLGTYEPPMLLSPLLVNTVYSYDADRLLTSVAKPDGQTINYNYGSTTGILNSLTTSEGTYSYGFDAYSNRTSSSSTPAGIQDSFGYSYGLLSSDAQTDTSTGTTVGTYGLTFNTPLQVVSDTVTPGSGSVSTINYLYDNDELIKKAGDLTITRSTSNARVTGTSIGSVTDSWTYNSFGEPLTYTFKYGSTTLYTYTLTRDALGRIATKADTVQGTTNNYAYTYDTSGRLTDVTKNSAAYSHYTYDSNSNQTGSNRGGTTFTSTFDAQDRLTAMNTYTFSPDQFWKAGHVVKANLRISKQDSLQTCGYLGR